MASSESDWHSEEEEEESVSMNSRDLGVILVFGPLCFLLSCFGDRGESLKIIHMRQPMRITVAANLEINLQLI